LVNRAPFTKYDNYDFKKHMTEMMGDDVFGGHGRIKQFGLLKTQTQNFKF